MIRPLDPHINDLRYAWAYTLGRSARSPEYHWTNTELEYYWRAVFDDHGNLAIYGLIKGTESPARPATPLTPAVPRNIGIQDDRARNHGPHGYIKAPRATLDAFLDYLEGVESSSPSSNAPGAFTATPDQRWKCESGRVIFTSAQTIMLCRILYDDESVMTYPRNWYMANDIIAYRRAGIVLQVA